MAQKTRTHMILVLAAAMLLATPALAQGSKRGGRGPGFGGPGHRGPHLAKVLDLDEHQQAQAKALRAEMGEDLAPVQEELRELRQQMRQLWTAESPDRAALLELGEQIDNLQGVVHARRSELRLELMEILTAEQRARLAEHRPGQAARGHGRRGPRLNGDNEGGQVGRGPGMRAGRGGPGMRAGRGLIQRLGLNEAQRTQVQALRSEMRQAIQPTRQQMQALRQQSRAQWTSEQPDTQAIQELQAQMSTFRSVLREHRVDFRLALLEILTPEQRTQLAETPNRGQGRGHGRGNRSGQ